MESNRIWDLFVELRKELLETQKIRSQTLGFKITFITAEIGLMAANFNSLDKTLFVIPAFGAIFFDFLIYSYSFSIKRIGLYCCENIEPILKKNNQLPKDFLPWQEYLTAPETKQALFLFGNFGFTLLTVVLAVFGLFSPYRHLLSSSLCISLAIFVLMDWVAYLSPRRLESLVKKPLEG